MARLVRHGQQRQEARGAQRAALQPQGEYGGTAGAKMQLFGQVQPLAPVPVGFAGQHHRQPAMKKRGPALAQLRGSSWRVASASRRASSEAGFPGAVFVVRRASGMRVKNRAVGGQRRDYMPVQCGLHGRPIWNLAASNPEFQRWIVVPAGVLAPFPDRRAGRLPSGNGLV